MPLKKCFPTCSNSDFVLKDIAGYWRSKQYKMAARSLQLKHNKNNKEMPYNKIKTQSHKMKVFSS